MEARRMTVWIGLIVVLVGVGILAYFNVRDRAEEPVASSVATQSDDSTPTEPEGETDAAATDGSGAETEAVDPATPESDPDTVATRSEDAAPTDAEPGPEIAETGTGEEPDAAEAAKAGDDAAPPVDSAAAASDPVAAPDDQDRETEIAVGTSPDPAMESKQGVEVATDVPPSESPDPDGADKVTLDAAETDDAAAAVAGTPPADDTQTAMITPDAEAPPSATALSPDEPPAADAPAVDDLAVNQDAEPVIPNFDIVRVEPTGDAVIAGLAQPGAMVELMRGDDAVATAEANERGEWAMALLEPLPPGSHDLAIRTTSPDESTVIFSDQRVAVMVPESADEEPLVVLNTPDAPSTIVQLPPEVAEAPATGETVVAAAPEPEAPATDEPVAAAPAEPTAETPATGETVVAAAPEPEAPATDEPVAAAPAEPTAETPATGETVVAAAPEAEAPATDEPVAAAPVEPAPETPATGETVIAAAPEAEVAASAEPAIAPEPQPEAPGAEKEEVAADPQPEAPTADDIGVAAGPEVEPEATTTDETGVAAADPAQDEAATVAESAEPPPALVEPADDEADAAVPASEPSAPTPEVDVAAVASNPESPVGPDPATPETDTATSDQPVRPSEPAPDEVAQEPLAEPEPEPEPEPVVVPEVAVTAVEAETAGALYIAGTAATGETVRVYMDDKLLGEAKPSPSGTWLLQADRDLPAGTYSVRADQVESATGSVLARAEVPFEREVEVAVLKPVADTGGTSGATATGSVGELQTVIIKRRDNLWRISRRIYGKGIRWSTIYQANKDQIRNPRWIYPGQVFMLPKGNTAWEEDEKNEPPG